MQWYALWCVWIIDCYCFPVFSCEAKVYAYEIPDLTIFESLINYIWFSFQSLWEDWDVLNDLFLMMSCCDMFDLTILESSISITLRYFLVAHWELRGIVIYYGILFGFSLRTDGYCDLFWDTFWLLVENRWILWFIINALQLLVENYCGYYDYHLMFSSFSWRTDVITMIIFMMLSSHFYRNEVILLWFVISWA